MSIFGSIGSIASQMLGGGQPEQGEQPSGVVGLVQHVIQENGGVGGLVEKFQQSGLGDRAASWVNSDNPNQTLSPSHISQVFSPDQIAGWASKFGVDPDTAKNLLAQAIPQAVDHATPDGEVPQQGDSIDWMGLAQRFLGGSQQTRD